jgi:hypothetical protein
VERGVVDLKKVGANVRRITEFMVLSVQSGYWVVPSSSPWPALVAVARHAMSQPRIPSNTDNSHDGGAVVAGVTFDPQVYVPSGTDYTRAVVARRCRGRIGSSGASRYAAASPRQLGQPTRLGRSSTPIHLYLLDWAAEHAEARPAA